MAASPRQLHPSPLLPLYTPPHGTRLFGRQHRPAKANAADQRTVCLTRLLPSLPLLRSLPLLPLLPLPLQRFPKSIYAQIYFYAISNERRTNLSSSLVNLIGAQKAAAAAAAEGAKWIRSAPSSFPYPPSLSLSSAYIRQKAEKQSW